MYYLLTGHIDNDWGGYFNFVTEAGDKESALKQLDADYICEEIREIGVEERIEREMDDLKRTVIGDYFRKYDKLPVKFYGVARQNFNKNKESQYKALEQFNKKIRCFKIINDRKYLERLSAKEFIDNFNRLCEAEDDAEAKIILDGIMGG